MRSCCLSVPAALVRVMNSRHTIDHLTARDEWAKEPPSARCRARSGQTRHATGRKPPWKSPGIRRSARDFRLGPLQRIRIGTDPVTVDQEHAGTHFHPSATRGRVPVDDPGEPASWPVTLRPTAPAPVAPSKELIMDQIRRNVLTSGAAATVVAAAPRVFCTANWARRCCHVLL